jgi:uncharacterized protein (TIRG00374 family)
MGVLALAFAKADSAKLAEALKSTRISYMPIAALAAVAVTWLMAYRWGVILSASGRKIPVRRLFVYYLIGTFFNNFVPGGGLGGDLARFIYASWDIQDRALLLSSLIYERLVGLLVLLVMGFGATLASVPHEAGLIYVVEAGLAAIFLVAVSLMSDWSRLRLGRLIQGLSVRFGLERAGRAALRTIESLSDLGGSPRLMAVTIAISVWIRVVWGLGCLAVARAMELPLAPLAVFAFVSVVDLVRMLPLSINGLGLREWAFIALFAGAGIGAERALMFSVLVFAPALGNAIAGGIIYILLAGRIVIGGSNQ